MQESHTPDLMEGTGFDIAMGQPREILFPQRKLHWLCLQRWNATRLLATHLMSLFSWAWIRQNAPVSLEGRTAMWPSSSQWDASNHDLLKKKHPYSDSPNLMGRSTVALEIVHWWGKCRKEALLLGESCMLTVSTCVGFRAGHTWDSTGFSH